MELNIIVADVLNWAREYDGPKFHALLADPPWHLKGGFMGRYWDRDGPDAIAFQPETWAALAEHLYPGAFLFIFAGSRGWHRLACALEDAGLIIQPSIFVWLNAQAFPKASRLRKAPKPRRQRLYRWLGWLGRLGNWLLRKRREPPKYYLDFVWQGHRYGGQILKDCASPIICAQKPWADPRLDCMVETGAGALNVDKARIGIAEGDDKTWRTGNYETENAYFGGTSGTSYRKDKPQGRWPPNFALCHVSPHLCPDCEGDGCEACSGEGVVGGCKRVGVKRVKAGVWGAMQNTQCGSGGTMGNGWAQRPTVNPGIADPDGLETVDAWECVEGCVCAKLGEQSGERKTTWISPEYANRRSGGLFPLGHPGSQGYNDKGTAARFFPQCGWEFECVESCPVAKLDEQAGESKSSNRLRHNRSNEAEGNEHITYGKFGDCITVGYNDSGGASRFYARADWSHEIAERLATSDPVRYCPKAAKRERSSGLDDFYWRKDKESPIGFIRVTEEEWEALGKEEERIKAETGKRVSLRARGNIHPTVKPISLCKWLATLLLPPKEYAPRRILIPFCGTFREGIGAMLAGWDEITGIELYRDYVDIAEAGARFWAHQLRQNVQLSFLEKNK